MICYRDKAFCSRSYSLGGSCQEDECFRILSVKEKKRADYMELPLCLADFISNPVCIRDSKNSTEKLNAQS